MATVYLTEQHATVRRDGEVLLVQMPADPSKGLERRSVEVPLIKVDRVVVVGNITFTTPALAMLLEQRIDLCFLTEHGRFLGHLAPELSKNAPLRIAQHAAAANESRALAIARACVCGKLANMRTMLLRANRKRSSEPLHVAGLALRRAQESAAIAEKGESLLGYEGSGTAAYFGVFEELLAPGWSFPGRHKRPPTDPINALLSFGYTVLTSAVASAIQVVGLDPFVGFLHQARYGKPSLALDLVEEFRPLVVDSCVLRLINNRMLDPGDFIQELGTCQMRQEARRTYLSALEERLETAIEHPLFEYKVTYRRCLELQARLLSKHLLGEISSYPPFVVR